MWIILSHVVPVSDLDHNSFTCGFLVRVTLYSSAFHYSIISTRFENKMDCTPWSMRAHWLLQSHTHADFRWVYPAVRGRTWMCYGKVQFRGFTLLAQQVTYNGTAWRRLQWKIQECLRLLCKTYVFQLSWYIKLRSCSFTITLPGWNPAEICWEGYSEETLRLMFPPHSKKIWVCRW
jgi:hypothetical protein